MEQIQIITALVALATLILSFKRVQSQPKTRLVTVPTILLTTHTLVFYFCVLFHKPGDGLEPDFLNTWSSILRLQSMTTFFILAYYGYKRGQLWNKEL